MRALYANLLLKKNKVIKALTYADFAVWSGSSLITTIFPLFVINQIPGATVVDAGISTMIFTAIPALLNIPLGKWMDSKKGMVDELQILTWSNILRGVSLIVLAFSPNLFVLYATQVVLGVAKSMNTTSWRVLFSKFLDQENLGKNWSIYDTIMSLGLGISAFLGGYIGENVSYQIVIVIGGIMSLIGVFFPLFTKETIEEVK